MKKKQVEKIDLEEAEEAEANSGLAEDMEVPLRLEAGGGEERRSFSIAWLTQPIVATHSRHHALQFWSNQRWF